jgi:hypothetical protein
MCQLQISSRISAQQNESLMLTIPLERSSDAPNDRANRLLGEKEVLNKAEFEDNLRPTVSRPVCLGVRRPSETRDQFFFLLEIFFR